MRERSPVEQPPLAARRRSPVAAAFVVGMAAASASAADAPPRELAPQPQSPEQQRSAPTDAAQQPAATVHFDAQGNPHRVTVHRHVDGLLVRDQQRIDGIDGERARMIAALHGQLREIEHLLDAIAAAAYGHDAASYEQEEVSLEGEQSTVTAHLLTRVIDKIAHVATTLTWQVTDHERAILQELLTEVFTGQRNPEHEARLMQHIRQKKVWTIIQEQVARTLQVAERSIALLSEAERAAVVRQLEEAMRARGATATRNAQNDDPHQEAARAAALMQAVIARIQQQAHQLHQ